MPMSVAPTVPYPVPHNFSANPFVYRTCGGKFRSGNVARVEGGVLLRMWKHNTPSGEPCDAIFIPTDAIPSVIESLRLA